MASRGAPEAAGSGGAAGSRSASLRFSELNVLRSASVPAKVEAEPDDRAGLGRRRSSPARRSTKRPWAICVCSKARQPALPAPAPNHACFDGMGLIRSPERCRLDASCSQACNLEIRMVMIRGPMEYFARPGNRRLDGLGRGATAASHRLLPRDRGQPKRRCFLRLMSMREHHAQRTMRSLPAAIAARRVRTLRC